MSKKTISDVQRGRDSITEGRVKKGGVNKPPSKPRPGSPTGQGGKSTKK